MRAVKTLTVAVLAGTLLAGCGLFGTSDPDPTDSGGGGTGTGSPTPDGPSPQELSEEVLAAAEQADQAAAIGTGTGTTRGRTEVTIDVTAVERGTDATLVRMRISGTDGGSIAGPAGFGNSKFDGISFARTLYLVDPTVTKTRYLPLQFTDYREACLCPYFPFEVGATPQTVTAVYPPLPGTVTTVDLVANDFLTVTGLPVGG